jgi:2-polyprenyl-3-methyl-5-hydroxy-6-metoxy-1,4-benzoquinol methylase
MTDYIKANKQFWNQNVEHHMQSDFYDVESFLAGKTSLRDIELALLGNVKDKTILHLQCHFGLDTLSLQRMGAQCTGVDFSEQAILQAKKLNSYLQLSATFICSDLFVLPQIHEHDYDIVFTTYGTIGWLPDINLWASLVSKYIKPGGKLIFAEFHPFVWMYDNDFTKLEYNYFNDAPIIELEEGTYADNNKDHKATSITWNHSMAEVMQALINNGLQIENVQEYNYSPYNCFKHTKQIASQKYIIEPFNQKVPLVYSLVCSKV